MGGNLNLNGFLCLPAKFLPQRIATCKKLAAEPAGKHHCRVAIDPCAVLLPQTEERLEEMQMAALGDARYMSKNSARNANNFSTASTAKKQASSTVLKVHWTPVLARGKLRVYVCDAKAAKRDPTLPDKLNNSVGLAKFVRNVLPGILEDMKQEYGWSTLPREVVHDKASYMVSPFHDRLNVVFADALEANRLRSWVGSASDSADWLCARFADVYPHETAISHIRRLLDHEFTCARTHETVAQFRLRMGKVVAHMNSEDFKAKDGTGLSGLCRSLQGRCERVLSDGGNRLSH